ncbi:hypothetical protein N483_05200 [Pseudoalteromonas luteoviolacea NCIMB 1944]|nr:hypothetical protein N483_05200 [Pseudoalteromonas luteoviolacea NCIMB 1944]
MKKTPLFKKKPKNLLHTQLDQISQQTDQKTTYPINKQETFTIKHIKIRGIKRKKTRKPHVKT